MKELVVIVRREKSAEVKSFLSSMGLDYVSKTVKGRGKEGGLGVQNKQGSYHVPSAKDPYTHLGGGGPL